MDFDDSKQSMIWRSRQECKDMNQPEIITVMIAEAKSIGYVPIDFNWANIPNIYLRGRFNCDTDDNGLYKLETEQWVEDGFVMFVKKAKVDNTDE